MAQTFKIGPETFTFRRCREFGRYGTTVTRTSDNAKGRTSALREDKIAEAVETGEVRFVVPAKVEERDRAECQVCERHQAIDGGGHLMNHGYKRPGWGFLVGGCPGVRHLPFPATDALEAVLPQLRAQLAYCEREAVNTAPSLVVRVGRGRYVGRSKTPTFTEVRAETVEQFLAIAEHPEVEFYQKRAYTAEEFERRQRVYRAQFEGEAARTRSEIKRVEARIEKGRALRGEG